MFCSFIVHTMSSLSSRLWLHIYLAYNPCQNLPIRLYIKQVHIPPFSPLLSLLPPFLSLPQLRYAVVRPNNTSTLSCFVVQRILEVINVFPHISPQGVRLGIEPRQYDNSPQNTTPQNQPWPLPPPLVYLLLHGTFPF